MQSITVNFSWKSFKEPEPESNLQGVVGQLRPSRYRAVPQILWNTRQIEAQLAESDGLVGYALRAKLPQRRFWAVAVWESDESLRRFVESDPHSGIKAALKGEMEESWFERFDVMSEDVPIDIDEAIAQVQ